MYLLMGYKEMEEVEQWLWREMHQTNMSQA